MFVESFAKDSAGEKIFPVGKTGGGPPKGGGGGGDGGKFSITEIGHGCSKEGRGGEKELSKQESAAAAADGRGSMLFGKLPT